jgi:C1A family cysteine protease
VESAILLKKTNKKHTKFDLSEQQQVDCAIDNYNGCNGGWMDWTYDYSIEKGLQNEKKYKYTGNYNGCSNEGGKWKIQSYKNIQASFSAVVSALKEQPLSVAVDATNWFFNGGSIIPYSYERQLNHAVILVGYFNGGCNQESQPYWRIKNSWGTDWADEGYANLAVGDDGNTFGIIEEVQQPIY